MRIRSALLLAAILAAQFSCGTLRQMEYDRNLRTWQESKIANYRMSVNLQKTGHAAPNGKFVITVRGGVAESIKGFDSDIDVWRPERFGGYNTIDNIFEFIERAEKRVQEKNGSWNIREVEYDSKLGYPKRAKLDEARVLDDEILFEVLQFEILAE